MSCRIKHFVVISVSIFIAVLALTQGFSFDGKTVPCKTVNVSGYPQMKEQYQRCNKSVYDNYKKAGVKPNMYGPILCTAVCGFLEDKLIDVKTGKLDKDALKNYDDMFNHIPEIVRKEIKDVFYNCFEEHKNETVYNSTKSAIECDSIMPIGICLKLGIDGVCNPSTDDDDDDSSTAASK